MLSPTKEKGARRRLSCSQALAAAGALFEPGHLGAVTAAPFLTGGCGFPLSRTLALGRTLLVPAGLAALGLTIARRLSAATATTLRTLIGVRIGAARLAVASMPAGMRSRTAPLRLTVPLRLLATRLG